MLVSGKGFLSRAIMRYTRSCDEPITRVTHAGIIHDGGPLRQATIIEALATGVQERSLWLSYGPSHENVAIWRTTLSEGEKTAIARAARRFINRKYGFHALIAYALTRRFLTSPTYPVCSLVVAWAYASVNLNFGVAPNQATPDDIEDWCLCNPTKARPIHGLTRLAEGWG